jgi:hypothetical protein
MTAFAREAALFVALAVASTAYADIMVCTTDAGVTHREVPLSHYRMTGTKDGNRTYFEDNKGRRWKARGPGGSFPLDHTNIPKQI